MKPDKQREAVRLRESGQSVKAIARELGVAVSSVSRWVRGVALTDQQSEALRLRNPNSLAGTQALQRNARERWERYREEGRELARQGDWAFLSGAFLYWGEGYKRTRNQISLSNADAAMVSYFVGWLGYAGVAPEEIRLTIQCYPDIRGVEEIEAYWIATTGLERSNLTKTIVNAISGYGSGKRCGSLEYGTCQVRVGRTDVLQRIYGALEWAGGYVVYQSGVQGSNLRPGVWKTPALPTELTPQRKSNPSPLTKCPQATPAKAASLSVKNAVLRKRFTEETPFLTPCVSRPRLGRLAFYH